MNNPPSYLPIIRPAVKTDLPAINGIYNYYVNESTSTFQLKPESDAGRRAWLKNHGEAYPVLVAEVAGNVVGWAALSAYSLRGGWRFTAEDSIYLDKNFLGRGIGKLLLQNLVSEARRRNFRCLIARICGEQAASIALHAGAGFVECGRLREGGEKFGRRLDVIYMQQMLPELPADTHQ